MNMIGWSDHTTSSERMTYLVDRGICNGSVRDAWITGWHTKKTVITKNRITSKIYLDGHKTSATLGQACVADIPKVSSLYYKNPLFH